MLQMFQYELRPAIRLAVNGRHTRQKTYSKNVPFSLPFSVTITINIGIKHGFPCINVNALENNV